VGKQLPRSRWSTPPNNPFTLAGDVDPDTILWQTVKALNASACISVHYYYWHTFCPLFVTACRKMRPQ
jgi:hypothetical protein